MSLDTAVAHIRDPEERAAHASAIRTEMRRRLRREAAAAEAAALVAPTEKRCPSCDQTKPVSAFARDSSRSDGLRGQCRVCHSLSRR